MKLNNTQIAKSKAGMTLLELTVVILVLLSLISILFIGARAWKRGSDRSANIMNIRNCQQAMRGEQNMRQLSVGSPFVQDQLEVYLKFPQDIAGGEANGGVSYTAGTAITAESANPAVNYDHIWLVPSAEGLPGTVGDPDADPIVPATTTVYGHTSPADVTGW